MEHARGELSAIGSLNPPELDEALATDPEAVRRRMDFLSDKNRKAQKRYRERQRERFSDFKKQVDALTQQVKGLMHDKECLQSRNELLETMMEEELKCTGGAARALTGPQSPDGSRPSTSASDAEAFALGMDEVCRSILKNLPPEQGSLILPDKHNKLYSVHDLPVLWQALCGELARLLALGADDPASSYHPQLLRMHHVHTRDVALHFEKRPVALRRIQIAAGYGDGTEPVWQKAAATLKLTREQERAILMARDAFKKGLINTAERRRSCLGVLAASPSDCILSEGRLAQLFVQEAQAADLVKATVMEEAALRNNLANAMRRILTPAQYCRWTIEVYPHPADWLALAHAVECLRAGNGNPMLPCLPAPSTPAFNPAPAAFASTPPAAHAAKPPSSMPSWSAAPASAPAPSASARHPPASHAARPPSSVPHGLARIPAMGSAASASAPPASVPEGATAAAASMSDDLFEGLSFAQATDFLQEFDFLQPDTGQVASHGPPGELLPSWLNLAGCSNALARG